MATAIEFNNISKQYRLGLVSTRTLGSDLNRWWAMNVRHQEDPYLKIGSVNDRSSAADSEFVWALRDIDFKVEEGDVVGIIGKNGAGKSTLLKLLSKVTAPTTGTIKARGRIGSLLEVGTGFHPEMTGRENIYLNGAILGMSKQEISSKLDEIVAFSGCERYIDTPTKRYSSGMTVRLGFAVASHLEPEILVVDEVLAVGDAEFQKKAIGKMREISQKEGRTVLFVSHNMTSVRSLCKSGIVLENGSVSFTGTVDEAVSRYLSLNQDTQGISIADRLDRFGNGKIKVKNIILRNESGEEVVDTFVGNYLRIEFHMDVQPGIDLSKLIVACKLADSFGAESVIWVSDEMKCDFSKMKDGVLSLVIPHLNVRPNVYSLNYKIDLGSTAAKDTCDSMNGACQVSVLNSSFFTDGVNLKDGRGYSGLVEGQFTTV